MKKLLIIIVSATVIGLVLFFAIRKGGVPISGTQESATSTPAQPSAGFRGPTGPPQIIGPSGPPPEY